MLWNSLSSARAGLKILGALLAQCSPESLLGCLGRAQLCWPEQEQPCLWLCRAADAQWDPCRALFTACPPHSPPVPAAPALPRCSQDGTGQMLCSCSAKADFLGESSAGAASPWLSPGLMQHGWCDIKTTSAETGDTSVCAPAHTGL